MIARGLLGGNDKPSEISTLTRLSPSQPRLGLPVGPRADVGNDLLGGGGAALGEGAADGGSVSEQAFGVELGNSSCLREIKSMIGLL